MLSSKQLTIICIHTAVAGGDFNRNFSMIKYPRHMLGLPNEKLFKMDTENMVNSSLTCTIIIIMWVMILHGCVCTYLIGMLSSLFHDNDNVDTSI